MVGRPAKRSWISTRALLQATRNLPRGQERAPQNFGQSISVRNNLARIIREQELLFDAFRNSKLEKLMLDITDRTVASVADKITAWFEQSGTLCVDDKVTKPESVPW